MGMGHFFRMINLYGALRDRGVGASIVLLGEHPPAKQWLEKANIPCAVVSDLRSEQPNWEADLAWQYKAKVWVNDRLQTDAGHALRVKAIGLKLVTFDDRGSGAALADLHVSALAGVRGEELGGTKVLTGLAYLILPPEIRHFRRQRSEARRWVVSLGGSDTYGVTVQVAKWLATRAIAATIISGPGFEHDAALMDVVSDKITTKKGVPSLPAEFAVHDVAITGGGMTAFEAVASGLPAMIVANESWEIVHGRYLQQLGCAIFVGLRSNIDFGLLEGTLDIQEMSRAGLEAVDVDGVHRVCSELVSLMN